MLYQGHVLADGSRNEIFGNKEVVEKIAALYYKRGDLKNYALYMSKMSEAKDSLYTRKKKYNMSELQSNINSSLSMKVHRSQNKKAQR